MGDSARNSLVLLVVVSTILAMLLFTSRGGAGAYSPEGVLNYMRDNASVALRLTEELLKLYYSTGEVDRDLVDIIKDRAGVVKEVYGKYSDRLYGEHRVEAEAYYELANYLDQLVNELEKCPRCKIGPPSGKARWGMAECGFNPKEFEELLKEATPMETSVEDMRSILEDVLKLLSSGMLEDARRRLFDFYSHYNYADRIGGASDVEKYVELANYLDELARNPAEVEPPDNNVVATANELGYNLREVVRTIYTRYGTSGNYSEWRRPED